MIVYNQKTGQTCNCEKPQLGALLRSGWQTKPLTDEQVEEIKAEAEASAEAAAKAKAKEESDAKIEAMKAKATAGKTGAK